MKNNSSPKENGKDQPKEYSNQADILSSVKGIMSWDLKPNEYSPHSNIRVRPSQDSASDSDFDIQSDSDQENISKKNGNGYKSKEKKEKKSKKKSNRSTPQTPRKLKNSKHCDPNFSFDFQSEILMKIFMFLPPKELCIVQMVQRKWQEISQSDQLWKKFFIGTVYETKPERKWRLLFKKCWRRFKVASEILSTETTYVNSLRTVVEVFLVPMREQQTKKTVSSEDLKMIFSEIEVICAYNSKLLSELEQRISDEFSLNELLSLGDIFKKIVSFLKVYTSYINHFNKALAAIAYLRRVSVDFRAYLEYCQGLKKCKGLTLNAFLIMPVQRIPRYVLLLEELTFNTPKSHPDFADLSESLAKMKDLAEYIDQKKKEAESVYEVISVQDKLIGKFENIVTPGRSYRFEGSLFEILIAPPKASGVTRIMRKRTSSSAGSASGVSSPSMTAHKVIEHYCFVFTDLLVIAKKTSLATLVHTPMSGYKLIKKKRNQKKTMDEGKVSYEWEKHVPINKDAVVLEAPPTQCGSEMYDNCFQLITEKQNFIFACVDAEAKETWVSTIKKTIADLKGVIGKIDGTTSPLLPRVVVPIKPVDEVASPKEESDAAKLDVEKGEEIDQESKSERDRGREKGSERIKKDDADRNRKRRDRSTSRRRKNKPTSEDEMSDKPKKNIKDIEKEKEKVETETEGKKEKEKEKETETERKKETETERKKETETERKKDSETERKKEKRRGHEDTNNTTDLSQSSSIIKKRKQRTKGTGTHRRRRAGSGTSISMNSSREKIPSHKHAPLASSSSDKLGQLIEAALLAENKSADSIKEHIHSTNNTDNDKDPKDIKHLKHSRDNNKSKTTKNNTKSNDRVGRKSKDGQQPMLRRRKSHDITTHHTIHKESPSSESSSTTTTAISASGGCPIDKEKSPRASVIITEQVVTTDNKRLDSILEGKIQSAISFAADKVPSQKTQSLRISQRNTRKSMGFEKTPVPVEVVMIQKTAVLSYGAETHTETTTTQVQMPGEEEEIVVSPASRSPVELRLGKRWEEWQKNRELEAEKGLHENMQLKVKEEFSSVSAVTDRLKLFEK